MSFTLSPSYQIQTRRFLLRIPNESDIPFIFSATRYEGFNDGMLWEPPESEAELIEPLKGTLKAWELGEGYSFTIVQKAVEEQVGRISIRRTDQEKLWDVGFWTHPAHQGEGVMSEALAAVLALGFEVLGAHKIQACHAIWNKASEKVLKRNGLTFERFIEQGFQKRGEWVAENLLSIEKQYWLGLRSE